MSAIYDKGNMRNIDKDGDGKDDHLQIKLINRAGSGSVTVDLRIVVDGIEMIDASTLHISDRPPERARPSMFLHADYGDTIVLEVKHDGKIGPGPHKVSLQAMVDWQTYCQDIEDIVR